MVGGMFSAEQKQDARSSIEVCILYIDYKLRPGELLTLATGPSNRLSTREVSLQMER